MFLLLCGCCRFMCFPSGDVGWSVVVAFPDHTHLLSDSSKQCHLGISQRGGGTLIFLDT